MDIIQIIGLLGFGSIFGSLIQHFLNRSNTSAERIYIYKKEELLRFRISAESVIEKLILIDGYRDLFLDYLQLSYAASCKKGSKFIDLNNTLDKSDFNKNKEQIATIIFLYFPDISRDWDDCLDGISKIATILNLIDLNSANQISIDWEKSIMEFNEINISLGDKPLEIINKIKAIISDKENEIISQKSKFYLV